MTTRHGELKELPYTEAAEQTAEYQCYGEISWKTLASVPCLLAFQGYWFGAGVDGPLVLSRRALMFLTLTDKFTVDLYRPL